MIDSAKGDSELESLGDEQQQAGQVGQQLGQVPTSDQETDRRSGGVAQEGKHEGDGGPVAEGDGVSGSGPPPSDFPEHWESWCDYPSDDDVGMEGEAPGTSEPQGDPQATERDAINEREGPRSEKDRESKHEVESEEDRVVRLHIDGLNNEAGTRVAIQRLYVSSDPDSGYGVVATELIPAGSHLFDYEGERLSRAELKTRYPENEGEYVMQLSPDLFIDARELEGEGFETNQARFLNSPINGHTANVAAWSNDVTVTIVAERDIPAGEELLLDYGDLFNLNRPHVRISDRNTRLNDSVREGGSVSATGATGNATEVGSEAGTAGRQNATVHTHTSAHSRNILGWIVNWCGDQYGGTPYILARTRDGLTFCVEKPPELATSRLHFKGGNTISFTPVPGRKRKLRRWPQAFPVGVNPVEVMETQADPPLIQGVIKSISPLGGTILVTVDEFHSHRDRKDKALKEFQWSEVKRELNGMLLPGMPVHFSTHTVSACQSSAIRWPLVDGVRIDYTAMEQRIKRATTAQLVASLEGHFDFNLEIGGSPLSPLVNFPSTHECRLQNIQKIPNMTDPVTEILELLEELNSSEFRKLSKEERRRNPPAVKGERLFRLARAGGQKLKILINPLDFRYLSKVHWIRFADRFMADHDGSLVESIHILTILDDRTEVGNFFEINSMRDLLVAPTRHLHSITFINGEVQLGRWSPDEWVGNRSDGRYLAATLDFYPKARESAGPAWKVLTPHDLSEEFDSSSSVREPPFNDGTAVLAALRSHLGRDPLVTARWMGGKITGRFYRRTGAEDFVIRSLKHKREEDRGATRTILGAPDTNGLRYFMFMDADRFFRLSGQQDETAVLLLNRGMDHNLILEALGPRQVFPLGRDVYRIELGNGLKGDTLEERLRLHNEHLKAEGCQEAFRAIFPTGLQPGEIIQAVWLSNQPSWSRFEGPSSSSLGPVPNRPGKIYIHGLSGDSDLDFLTRVLRGLNLGPQNHPCWVMDEGFDRPLVECQVPDTMVYEGVNTKEEGIDICIVKRSSQEPLWRERLFSRQETEGVGPAPTPPRLKPTTLAPTRLRPLGS